MNSFRDLKPEQEPALFTELDQTGDSIKVEEFNPTIGMGARVLELIDEAFELTSPGPGAEIPDNLVGLSEYRSTKQTEEPPAQSQTTESSEPKSSLSPEQLDLFNSIYKEYAPNIKSFVRSIAGSDAVAEEITQEAFIKIFRNLDKFEDREGGSLRAWVYRVARNTSFNYTRQARAHPTSLSDKLDYATEDTPGLVRVVASGSSTEDPALTVDNREEFMERLKAYDGLPQRYKEVLALSIQEVTYEEMAEILDITVPTVKSLLVRARESFAQRYTLSQWTDPDNFID